MALLLFRRVEFPLQVFSNRIVVVICVVCVLILSPLLLLSLQPVVVFELDECGRLRTTAATFTATNAIATTANAVTNAVAATTSTNAAAIPAIVAAVFPTTAAAASACWRLWCLWCLLMLLWPRLGRFTLGHVHYCRYDLVERRDAVGGCALHLEFEALGKGKL
jgi:hypothetical protein